jgi:diguanylate cyclase (GGDEF)-like protein
MRSERLTPTDAVTGLLNAASFMESLHKLLFEPDRKPVSVLSLSLDNFRNVNETLGHHSGDRLLQSVARVLKDAVDEKNLVARYAGDTFVVALIGSDSNGVLKVAERIEECFNSYASVSHIPRMCKVGISIGIASCPDDGTTAKSLVAAAEARQHDAKHQKKKGQEIAA